MEDLTYRADRPPLTDVGGIDCHVRDMTARVCATVTLAQFQSTLAQHDQWLPIDGDDAQPLGALISADSTGPLRLGYGAWRDLLLGVQFTNGQGDLVTAGGRTVKNVAGYDLTKFMVGQRGIFGSLVTLTTRTYLRPAGALLARHAPDASILRRLIATSLRPQWAALSNDALFCGYLGDEPTLAFYAKMLGQTEPQDLSPRSIQEDIDHRQSLWSLDGPVTLRASLPPAQLADIGTILTGVRWTADPAFGVGVAAVDSLEAARSIKLGLENWGATVKISRGLYGPAIDWPASAAERQIIERLKTAFDPEGALHPLPWSIA